MTKTQIIETIFKAGKDAHDKGVLRAEAPYNKGSRRYAEWVQGWDAALKAGHGDMSKLTAKADAVPILEVSLVSAETEDISILGDLPTAR